MTSDFDDTVQRPPWSPPRAVEPDVDLEDTTITWKRPVTAPIELVLPPTPPGPPAVTTAPLPIVVLPAEDVPGVASAAEPGVPEPGPEGEREPEADLPALPEPELPAIPEPGPEPELDSDVDDETIATPPAAASAVPGSLPALVTPPAPSPPPLAGTAVPDVADNIWSEPLPSKPLPFRIRLDDGTLVPLDQPVYLGRKPSVPRIHPGGIPLLVTLDSPQREVSATHLVLTTVGGAIVARDLRSSNGSIVRVPGTAAHTLLGGESTVVTPGTVIELGDGNSIELLAPDHPERDDRSD